MVSSRFTVPGEREAEPQLGQVMQGLVYGLLHIFTQFHTNFAGADQTSWKQYDATGKCQKKGVGGEGGVALR